MRTALQVILALLIGWAALNLLISWSLAIRNRKAGASLMRLLLRDPDPDLYTEEGRKHIRRAYFWMVISFLLGFAWFIVVNPR